MKRKFSLFVTIVVCLLLVVGILSACNDDSEQDPDGHVHSMELIAAKGATCTEGGNNAYYYCSGCGKYFKDEAGTQETTVEAETIPAVHKIVDGKCTICGKLYTEGLEYTLSSDETYYIVTGIGTASGDIIIPDTYKGLPVKEIASTAFTNCTNLTSVEIPASVTTIQDGSYNVGETVVATSFEGAFAGCSNLESVTFAEGSELSGVGDYAFMYCISLKSIDIPDAATRIGGQAFRNCSSLTSIDIPAGVTSIGGWAFQYCRNLESVTFAEGSHLTSIGSGAFWNCSSLKSIEIPAWVISIGYNAFYGCSNLESVSFAEGSQLNSIGFGAFLECSSLKSIEIPAGVTSIGSVAFSDCSNLNMVYYAGSIENWFNIEFEDSSSNPLNNGADLYIGGELVTEVVVPESVTTIGYQLTGCTSLTSITIHSGVTSIGDQAFYGCSNLESVRFAEGSQLSSIGSGAFYNCISLKSIEIPAEVTELPDGSWNPGVFSGCSNLESVSFAEGSQLTSIGTQAFSECISLKSIEIPEGVTSIGSSAFASCSSLKSIEIPAAVTSIGDSAFGYCSNLESVTFAEGSELTSIGSWAFYDCSSLKSIEIPVSVTSIGENVFSWCYLTIVYNYSDLEITAGNDDFGDVAYYAEVVLTEDNLANVKDENGYVTYTDGEEVLLLGYLGSEKDIDIPEGVTRIVDDAFREDDIISVKLPESLTAIGDSAFENCYTLKEVYNNSSLDISAESDEYGYVARYAVKVYTPEDQESAFDEKGFAIDEDGVLRGYNGSETAVTIPDSVTSITDYAFYGNTNITSVTIPAGVTSIGSSAFSGCSNLENVIFAEGSQLTSIGSSSFSGCSSLTSIEIPVGVTSIEYHAFSECSRLTSIDIPAGVTSIGNYAFEDCSSLESVSFAEGSELTSIGGYAFYVCSSLTSIEIPAGVTSIGDWTFGYCSSLKSIEIPEGVTSIGDYAFYGCSSLTSIEIPAEVTSIEESAFGYCSNLKSVTFAEGSQLASIGRSAFYRCSSLTSIEIPAGVTSIGDYVFEFCYSLETIYYHGTEEEWDAIGKGWSWNSFCGVDEVVFLGDAGDEGGEA